MGLCFKGLCQLFLVPKSIIKIGQKNSAQILHLQGRPIKLKQAQKVELILQKK